MSQETVFILNDQEVRTDCAPGTLVLDFLRHRSRLVGTKEGCREGDCGACVVLIGKLAGSQLSYQPVTSCLMPIGELGGRHLVTIEGLNLPDLTPVQQAIVDEGASQCGFCTPGIVVSLTGYLMQADLPIDVDGVKYALSGHLCRCTGYRSLKACADRLRTALGERTGIDTLLAGEGLPRYFQTIPDRLKALPESGPSSDGETPVVIAGGTDLYVQIGEDIPESKVDLLNLRPELSGISQRNGHLRIGASTTFEDFAADRRVQELMPSIRDDMSLIASWQIRNRATLGGNIVNASPIGDMTILLLALEAQLVLERQEERRVVPIIDFFLGYKKLDIRPDEILLEILIPRRPGSLVDFEKVSKRRSLDIASVNSAMRADLDGDTFREVGLAVGGVAPVPLFMRKTRDFLTGRTINLETLRGALEVARTEISPISDVRGSAEYKRLLAGQLLKAHFVNLFPEQISLQDLN